MGGMGDMIKKKFVNKGTQNAELAKMRIPHN